MLADKLFAKAVQSLKTLDLESPTTFDEIFIVTLLPFFIPDCNLLSCELDNFTLKCYIESFYIDIILK